MLAGGEALRLARVPERHFELCLYAVYVRNTEVTLHQNRDNRGPLGRQRHPCNRHEFLYRIAWHGREVHPQPGMFLIRGGISVRMDHIAAGRGGVGLVPDRRLRRSL